MNSKPSESFYTLHIKPLIPIFAMMTGVLLGIGVGDWVPGSAPAIAGVASILFALTGFIRLDIKKTEGWLSTSLFFLFLLFGALFSMAGIGL